MLKKALIVSVVVLCVCTISFSCFADGAGYNNGDNSDTSLYGYYDKDGTGLGFTAINGVQYLRGGLTHSNQTNMSHKQISYIDFADDSSPYNTSVVSGYSGNNEVDLTIANPNDSYPIRRRFFPANYLGTSTEMPVIFQWVYYDSQRTPSSSYSNTTEFTAGSELYFANFLLHFPDTPNLNKLKFTLFNNMTANLQFSGNIYLIDQINSKTLTTVPITNDNVMTVNYESDKLFGNSILVRVQFKVKSTVSQESVFSRSNDTRIYYYFTRISMGIRNVFVANGENSAIQAAADSAAQEGQDSVDSTAADEASGSFSALTSSMSYNGTSAVLNIPSFTWGIPGIIPERNWFEGVNVDMGAYINQYVPSTILTIIRALCDIAIVFFCAKELYNLISLVLVNRKADDD